MVRTQNIHCHGLGSIPGQGTKILQAVWHSQKRGLTGSKPLVTKAGCGCPELHHPTSGLDTNNSPREEMARRWGPAAEYEM